MTSFVGWVYNAVFDDDKGEASFCEPAQPLFVLIPFEDLAKNICVIFGGQPQIATHLVTEVWTNLVLIRLPGLI